jgi:hypothetical protein
MSPELIEQFEYLNVRLDQMADRIRELPTDVQNQPVVASFSPRKALEHMAATDQMYLDVIKKTDASKLKGKRGKANFIFGKVLQKLNSPAGKNVPSLPMLLPKQELEVEESIAKWKSSRAQIIEHMNKFDDDDAAIKHPFFGLMSPYDLFLLLEKHQDYHDARLPS